MGTFLDKMFSYLPTDALTVVIGFFLTYYSLAMFLADRICTLLNQAKLSQIFVDIEELDQELLDFNIKFDNRRIKISIICVLIVTVLCEVMTFVSTFALLVEHNYWTAWLWTFTVIPTFCNTLDKLWYMGILWAVRQRYEAINKAFDNMAEKLAQKQKHSGEKKEGKKNDAVMEKKSKIAPC